MQRPGIIQTVEIDGKEIGAFAGFQRADVGPAKHSRPAACGQFAGHRGQSSIPHLYLSPRERVIG